MGYVGRWFCYAFPPPRAAVYFQIAHDFVPYYNATCLHDVDGAIITVKLEHF